MLTSINNPELIPRFDAARSIVDDAARLALSFFRDVESLQIDSKGLQDWVSDADRAVELNIRERLEQRFPQDSIAGEELPNKTGSSEYTWVIDPIDGTTSFVNGTPGWCVVLACVDSQGTVIGLIRDPVADETYEAVRGAGARLNDRAIHVTQAQSLTQGSVAVGHNSRINPDQTLALLSHLLKEGGMFYRMSSGALMLCYVAAGRLIGYCEPHMNGWDCMAALLIISEAGGSHRAFDAHTMIESGGRVVAGGPGTYPLLLAMSDATFGPDS